MVNNNGSDEAIRVLVEQYKENMKTLIREGKLSHGSLEQHLSFVIGSVNEEIKKITEDLIKEEEIKKKLLLPALWERNKNQCKSGKNRSTDHTGTD
ncbi:MAG: hypothetical protein DDT30_01575 [Dehalococcoidia bacterium]|nr:hypothetical protein [Bacillota bacterium]